MASKTKFKLGDSVVVKSGVKEPDDGTAIGGWQGRISELDSEAMEKWREHLAEVLSFPFEAAISEYQERGPLREGDKLVVRRIKEVDDLCGVLVDARQGRRKHVFPLCDLEVTDPGSSNRRHVRDYATWFANR